MNTSISQLPSVLRRPLSPRSGHEEKKEGIYRRMGSHSLLGATPSLSLPPPHPFCEAPAWAAHPRKVRVSQIQNPAREARRGLRREKPLGQKYKTRGGRTLELKGGEQAQVQNGVRKVMVRKGTPQFGPESDGSSGLLRTSAPGPGLGLKTFE